MFNKKKKIGESEDKNFARYSERIFSNDEGLKDKAHQDLVAALEDQTPFYLMDEVYFKCFHELDRDNYVLEFYKNKDDIEPYRIILEKDEFDKLFEYVIAVREDIFSNISIEKDGVVINFGRNITGTYWLDVVDNYKILFKVAGNRSLMIKLVHSLFYAKHYQN